MTARTPFTATDTFGRTFTIAGAGETASLQTQAGNGGRVCGFEADGDLLVDIAYEALERATATVDCDEVMTAVNALRMLRAREQVSCAHEEVERWSGIPAKPYLACSKCDAVLANPVGEPF